MVFVKIRSHNIEEDIIIIQEVVETYQYANWCNARMEVTSR